LRSSQTYSDSFECQELATEENPCAQREVRLVSEQDHGYLQEADYRDA
jgi:hypothetical protein